MCFHVLKVVVDYMYVKYTLHMSITNKLKDLRLEREINQSELARNCDVSRQTIHSIEVSKYTPSVELALRIAKVLQISVEEIFFLKGDLNEE